MGEPEIKRFRLFLLLDVSKEDEAALRGHSMPKAKLKTQPIPTSRTLQ